MADVTIQQLSRGTPTGNNILPYSTSSSTLGVPVSAILQNAGNIGIGTTSPAARLDVAGGVIIGTGSGEQLVLRKGSDIVINDGFPGVSSDFNIFIDNTVGHIRIDRNVDNDSLGSLKVDALNGISLNGTVTKPFQPYLEAYVSAFVQPDYNFTDWYTPVVKYNTIIKQIGSNYNTNTGIFTAPAAGVYIVNAGAHSGTNAGVVANNIILELWGVVNGSRNITFSDFSSGPSVTSETRHGTGLFYLNAGDTFGVKAYGSSVQGHTIIPSGAHSYLRIAFLG